MSNKIKEDKTETKTSCSSHVETAVSLNSITDDAFKSTNISFQKLQIATKGLEIAYANLAQAIIDSQGDC